MMYIIILMAYYKSIHPSMICHLSVRVTGKLDPIPTDFGKRRCTPFTGHKSITGLTQTQVYHRQQSEHWVYFSAIILDSLTNLVSVHLETLVLFHGRFLTQFLTAVGF